MSLIPIDGYNNIYTTDNMNAIYLNTLNPLGIMANFAVTIAYPTFPSLDPEEDEEPTFTLDDFLVWVPTLKPYLEDGEDSSIYAYYTAMLLIAKTRVRWSVIYDENIWKRMVSLYLGHYIETFIHQLKDEAARMSLNPQNANNDIKLEFEVGKEVFENLRTTTWGRQFWFEWQPYGRFEHFGLNY